MISVIIPTLDAAGSLTATLRSLTPGAHAGLVSDVVVADAGSEDDTCAAAEAFGARVIQAPRGRGAQLAAGAAAAKKPWLMFLHADTTLTPGWAEAARAFMAVQPERAGYFRFKLDDASPAAGRLEAAVAMRCALLRLPYGDQGLLISRALYNRVGGYAPLPLFEDVDLVRRLGRGRLRPIEASAVTSAERFRAEGYLRRSTRNLALLARFYLGARPERLAAAYARRPGAPA